MCYYVYADHAQYTIKTYAKMALFPLVLTGPLSILYAVYCMLYAVLFTKIMQLPEFMHLRAF